jgi:hypothetical protein
LTARPTVRLTDRAPDRIQRLALLLRRSRCLHQLCNSLRASGWGPILALLDCRLPNRHPYHLPARRDLRVDYLDLLQVIPGISGSMIAQVEASLAAGGLSYTPFLAFGGVPLKVYAASAFSLGLSLGAVLLWTVFARVVRIAPTYAVAAAIRVLFGRQIDRRPGIWLAGLGLFWLAFYIWYFNRM